MRKSRKIGLWVGAATVVVAAASWGFSTLNGASEAHRPVEDRDGRGGAP